MNSTFLKNKTILAMTSLMAVFMTYNIGRAILSSDDTENDDIEVVPATPEENEFADRDNDIPFEIRQQGEAAMIEYDKAQHNLRDNKKDIAMLDNTDRDYSNDAEETLGRLYKNNSKDMDIDLIQYKHSKAQLDSIRAYFPIFDEYKNKYDKDYIKDVTLYTQLPDKTSGINCTKELASDILSMCKEVEHQKSLGNKYKANELLNEATFEIIKKLEGVERYAYLDKHKKMTIGDGICIDTTTHKANAKMVQSSLKLNKDQFKDIYSGKKPLSDKQLIILREKTIGKHGSYNKIVRNKIMASYGFNPAQYDYKKKPKNVSDNAWKQEYATHVKKYNNIADDMIETMPAHLYVAMRALVHHNPRSLTNLKASEIKALNSKDPSLKAIATLIDSYNGELMKAETFTSNTLLERAFLTECIMVGDANHTMRSEAIFNTIEHMSITLGKSTGNANFAIVGPKIDVSAQDLEHRNLHNRKILLAHSDGAFVKIVDTKTEFGKDVQHGRSNKPIEKSKKQSTGPKT